MNFDQVETPPQHGNGTIHSEKIRGKRRVVVKTKAQLTDDSIMGTNNSSIVSKRCVERLYYPNEAHFFRYFVKKPQRRAPLINRGYWLRMKAIDHAVKHFLEQESSKNAVVINLGCGYDPLPWQCLTRYPEASAKALFIDIDYKDLMLKKRTMVEATSQLHSCFTNVKTSADEIIFQSDQYIQLACDLRNLSALDQALRKIVDLETSRILFTAEVSVTYMDKTSADALIKYTATLPDARFCILEQLMPAGIHHPFAKTMMAHFNKLGTPLHSVQMYPTTRHQEERFISLGWKSARARNLWNLWSSADFMTDDERQALDLVEPFDEWEEFALFGCHYVLLVASTDAEYGSVKSSPSNGIRHDSATSPMAPVSALPPAMFSEYQKGKGCNRFASPIVTYSITSPQLATFGVYGGMGLTTRVDSLDIYTSGDGLVSLNGNHQSSIPPARMCHTTTDLGEYGTILVGGRTSPDTALRDCWLYHKYVNVWERIEDIPKPRYRHASVALGGGYVLVTPGRADSKMMATSFLVWSREAGWKTCRSNTSLPPPSFGCTGFRINSESLIQGLLVGGITQSGTVQQSAWKWTITDLHGTDPVMDFKELKMNNSLSLLMRFGASIAVDEKFAYVVGGICKDRLLETSQEICRVDLNDLTVMSYSIPVADTSRPLLVGTTVALRSGNLIIVGGSAVCFSFGTFWNKGCYTISMVSFDREVAELESGEIRDGISAQWAYQSTYSKAHQAQLSATIGTLSDRSGSNTSIVSVPRLRLESAAQFEQLLAASKPVIIEAADIGSCTSKWSDDYLKQQVGDREVVIHESNTTEMDFVNKNFVYKTMKFTDFIDDISRGSKVYLRSLSHEKPSDLPANLAQDFPSIASDFSLPPTLSYVTENTHSSPLRISAGVNMWLHYDVMANVLCQVRGIKRLLLFPPSDVQYFNFSPGSSSSSVDVFNDLSQHPHSHPHEVLLNPGDILFLPALWLHAASPLADTSISVNVFFRSLTSGYSVGRDVYGNRDLQAYEKGRQDIAKMTKSFEGLPSDVREFYLLRLVDELRSKARI